ncbi:MAG: GNAT family N-acetyltransferase [Thermomicrobiales bacterium]
MRPTPGQLVALHDTPFGSVQIRYPNGEDAQGMLDYINALSAERTYVSMQGEQFELEDEEAFLFARLEEIALERSVTLLATFGERVIGITHIAKHGRVEEHVAGFGISVSKDFRGCGLGNALMTHVIAEAERVIDGLRIIMLDVYSANEPGINLYRKHGFEEFGRLREGLLHNGVYLDRVMMARHIVPPAKPKRARRTSKKAVENPETT